MFRQKTQSAIKFPKVPYHISPLACLNSGTHHLWSLLAFHSTPRGSLRWPGLKSQAETSPNCSLFMWKSVPEAVPIYTNHFISSYLLSNFINDLNSLFHFQSSAVPFQIASFWLGSYSVIFSLSTYSKQNPRMQSSSSSKTIGRAIHLWCPFAARCSFSLHWHINLWRVTGEIRWLLPSDISQSAQ